MWGGGTHCVCVCVCLSITALAGTTSPLKAKVRYQQKTLDVYREQFEIDVGTELKILSSKVTLTVISLWQEIDANKPLVLLEGDY